jgi:hypothetical protein
MTMSDNKAATQLTEEQVHGIAGGCTAAELQTFIDNLQQNYEKLIEFTSYVMERVSEK